LEIASGWFILEMLYYWVVSKVCLEVMIIRRICIDEIVNINKSAKKRRERLCFVRPFCIFYGLVSWVVFGLMGIFMAFHWRRRFDKYLAGL
jgi:hypothetical protein